MIKEAAQMAKDMYGPNGEQVANWISMMQEDLDLRQQLTILAQLQQPLASTREQTLQYAENNNLVKQLNRAVQDLNEAYGGEMTDDTTDAEMAFYDTLVFITEILVVANCWEV